MTADEIALIRASFASLGPTASSFASSFYTRLFELDPDLRPLFVGDMDEQGRKLVSMLRVVVNGLDRLDEITPAIEALGKRHVDYSVKAEHYDSVGGAFIWALDQALGDGFTPGVHSAWANAYGVLAHVMKTSAAA